MSKRVSQQPKFERSPKISQSPISKNGRMPNKQEGSPFRQKFLPSHSSEKTLQQLKGSMGKSELSETKGENAGKDVGQSKAREEVHRAEEANSINGIVSNICIPESFRMEFQHEELQFPMTARSKAIIANKTNGQQPNCPELSRTNPKSDRERELLWRNSNQLKVSHSKNFINQLQTTLKEFQSQTEDNQKSIEKLKQEIKLLKEALGKPNQITQAKLSKMSTTSAEIQKLVKDECRALKTQLELSKNQQIQQKLKMMKMHFRQQIIESEQKIQQKLCDLNHSLLEQMHANVKRHKQISEKEKLRVTKMESENQRFLGALEQAMMSINAKVEKSSRMVDQPGRDDASTLFQAKIFNQIKKEFITNFSESQNAICEDLRNVMSRLEKLEGFIFSKQVPKLCGLESQLPINGQHSPANLEPLVEGQDFSFERSSSFGRMGDANGIAQGMPAVSIEFGEILHHLSLNYSSLEERSGVMEKCMSEVVWVLNGLLERVKNMV